MHFHTNRTSNMLLLNRMHMMARMPTLPHICVNSSSFQTIVPSHPIKTFARYYSLDCIIQIKYQKKFHIWRLRAETVLFYFCCGARSLSFDLRLKYFLNYRRMLVHHRITLNTSRLKYYNKWLGQQKRKASLQRYSKYRNQ